MKIHEKRFDILLNLLMKKVVIVAPIDSISTSERIWARNLHSQYLLQFCQGRDREIGTIEQDLRILLYVVLGTQFYSAIEKKDAFSREINTDSKHILLNDTKYPLEYTMCIKGCMVDLGVGHFLP